MSKSIGLEKLRRNLSHVIGEVKYGEQTYIIESYGHPMAVLLSIDEYEQLTTISAERRDQPSRVVTPHLADPSQAVDFELEVVEEATS